MSYIGYMIVKLVVFFVLAVIYGFIRRWNELKKPPQRSEARD